ncbi:MAG: crossover junction endodeoxyribonuclease RuvC [Alphaproteobacteria bacterium]|nr:crossover junction endodeoxyribonuclease RuvC [Alphaproteobacteria bacterium]OJV12138.1 MAG: hypothetical protein BGO27_05310 [Alphaproteobacteria bacterium 33-17]
MTKQPYFKRYIGIDPSSVSTGWAILDSESRNKVTYIASGEIKLSNTLSFQEKLLKLNQELSQILQEYTPTHAAMEETFVNINPKTSLLLAQFRGSIALSISLFGLDLKIVEPRLVKKTISGSGAADKAQIQKMVKMLFPSVKITSNDQTDAIATAYTALVI